MKHFLLEVAEYATLSALAAAAIIHAISYVKYIWSKK